MKKCWDDVYTLSLQRKSNDLLDLWWYYLNSLEALPGSGDPFVVVLWVDSQYADPWTDVDQQHGEGVVQATGPLDAVVCVRRVLEVVTLWVAVEAHRVHEEQPVDQTVQLIQLQQFQIRYLGRQKYKTYATLLTKWSHNVEPKMVSEEV